MKLLSYHIENYGKLQNVDGTFDAGLTCFCQENGSGKTTLASFIKAMFYGLPSYTVASKGFNDRQHFYPFSGGKFGGNLTFEAGGKVYKIERFFDKKSAKNDEMKVLCGGAPYLGFSETPGKDLFGLDEESFEKTVFITAEEIEIGSTHSINEKLNGTVQGEDEGNFEAAIDALEKVRKELKAARGNNDKISKARAEIVELTHEIHNLEQMGNSLRTEYVERERLVKEIAALEKAVREGNELGLVLQKWETLDSMTAQAEEKRQAVATLEEKYPQGIPNETERKCLHAYAREEAQKQGGLQMAAFGVEKEEALERLTARFKNGMPTDLELREKQEEIARLGILQAELAQNQTELTQKQRALESRFALGIPTEAEFAEKRALVEEYKRKDNESKGVSAALAQSAQPQPLKRNKATIVLGVLAAVLIVTGVCMFFVNELLAAGLFVGGAALGVVASIWDRKHGVNKDMPQGNVNLALISLQSELRMLEEKIRAFTVPYGYYSDGGAVYDFNRLEEDAQAYREYKAAAEQANARRQERSQEAQALQETITAFLSRYGEQSNDLQTGLTRLIGALQALRDLQVDKQAFAEKSKASMQRLQEITQSRKELLEKYGLPAFVGTMDGLNALDLDANNLDTLRQECLDLQNNIQEYKTRNGLMERPMCERVDADTMHETLSLRRKELADCDKRIAETERDVERLPDVENRLVLSEEKLAAYQDRHALLSDTVAALKTAEQTLKDKYVAPIKERFCTYATALSRIFGEKIGMDKDFHIVFERGGEERSERHLSAGERSLCALCLRLALIDNMYENEQPFVVMDDPFVHLDASHMEKTAELMKALAQDKQIIYFCCHETRSI